MMNNQINLRTKNALEFDQKDSLKETTSKICGLVSELDLSKIEASKSSKKYLKMCIEDAFKFLEAETSIKLSEIKDKFDRII